MSIKKAWPILTLVMILSLAVVVPKAGAVTIAELLVQIQALQAQLTQLQGGTTAATTACTFTKSLYLGVSDPQVKCLQQYLNGAGYVVSTSGAGSVGNETNYYGGKTQAAVAKWQAANAVSPAAGYFGAISRAKYSAVAGGGVVTPGGVTTPAPAAGGLSVGLSATTPASRTIIASAAMMPFGKFSFTAGSGNVTVTSLKFTRSGISSDAELGSAYLYDADTGDYIGQYTGLGSGILSFANSSGFFTVNAGTTKNIELRLDVSSSASNNHTMAWGLNAATDVVSNATSVSGNFPMTTNAMTFVTVSNPAIATLTATAVTTGSSVNAGTMGYLAGSFTLQSSNSAVLLDRIVLTQNGSIISGTDVTNIKLVTTGGAQIGATLANLKSDGTGTFVMSPAYEIPSGQTIQVNVYADVIAGVNRTMKFNLLNLRDVLARDKTYNVGVNPDSSEVMTSSTVEAGTLTLTLDPSSPTGNIAPGQTNVTVLKVKVVAYGEQVKVLYIPFRITMTGGAQDFTDEIDNIYLVDDAGNQIGTTLTAPSAATDVATIWDDTETTDPDATFGTSSATINYLIPANTTRIWSLKLDLLSTADATDLAANLQAGSNNYQGQISLVSTGDTTSVTGNTLTITSNPFQAKKNTAYGSQTMVKGQNASKIGSFILSASSAEGINISTITVTSTSTLDLTTTSSDFAIANLTLKINSVQFGDVKGSVTTSAATDYTFAGSAPVAIPAGGNATVDVYADILTNTNDVGPGYVIRLKNASAVGMLTATTQTLKDTDAATVSTTFVNGQNVTVQTTGGTITIARDASSPAAGQVVMGATGKTLAIWRINGTSVSDTNITDLTVHDVLSTAGHNASFENVQFYKGGVPFGSVLTAGVASSTTSFKYIYHFTTPLVIPQNSGISLELRGNVSSYASGGATSNSGHTFRIQSPGDVTALSTGGSLTVSVTGTPNGNVAVQGTSETDARLLTVARSKLSVTSDATSILTSGHITSAADVMAVWVFTSEGYDVTISTVTMKLSGSVLGSVVVKLIDADTNTAWGSSISGGLLYAVTSDATNASTSISFFPNYTLSAGATKRVKVQVDTTGSTNPAKLTASDQDNTFTVTTAATTGTNAQWSIDNDTARTYSYYGAVAVNAICWNDASSATLCPTGTGFNLESKVLPVYGPAIRY